MMIDFVCQALVLLIILVPVCMSIVFVTFCITWEKKHGFDTRDWEENYKDFDQGQY